MKDSHTKTQGMIGLDKLWADVKDAGISCRTEQSLQAPEKTLALQYKKEAFSRMSYRFQS